MAFFGRLSDSMAIRSIRSVLNMLGGTASSWLCVAAIAGLGLSAAEAVLAVCIGRSFDVLVSRSSGLTGSLLGSLVGALVFRAILQAVAQTSSSAVAIEVSKRLRVLAMDSALFGEVTQDGPFVSGILGFVDYVPRTSQFFQIVAALSTQSIQACGLAALLCWLEPRLALWILCALLLAGAAILFVNLGGAHRTSHELLPAQRAVVASLDRLLRNLTFVRALRFEDVERARVKEDVERHGRAARRATGVASVLGALGSVLGGAVLIGVLSQVMRTNVPPRHAVLELYLATRMLLAVAAAGTTYAAMGTYRPAVSEVLRKHVGLTSGGFERRRATADEPRQDPTPGSRGPCHVRFTGVTFSFPGREPVLEEMSFEIPAGAMAAITGPSGAGKSTVVALLLGLLEPSAGEVRIDGEPPERTFSRSDVRVGYVGAEPHLFAGTIRENLLYGNRQGASDEALLRALSEVQLDAVVAGLTGGLDHRLGPQGEGLSMGEKQRVALARAFVAMPRLIVLDEATSNVDSVTERVIAQALRARRGTVTCVICAHRSILLEDCSPTITVGGGASAEERS